MSDESCPICYHPHLSYLNEEPCVSCGCEGPDNEWDEGEYTETECEQCGLYKRCRLLSDPKAELTDMRWCKSCYCDRAADV